MNSVEMSSICKFIVNKHCTILSTILVNFDNSVDPNLHFFWSEGVQCLSSEEKLCSFVCHISYIHGIDQQSNWNCVRSRIS